MKKYLYLQFERYANTWINGGTVPLFKASKYRREDRLGIYTPDENQIDNSTHSDAIFDGRVKFGPNAQGYIGSLSAPGIYMQNIVLDRKVEDGVILCLANRRSNFIAKKLKKEACVEIVDVIELKNILDEQIGITGVMGECSYTNLHHRNHFLKSSQDSWQDEFRIFWKDADDIEVKIPKGLAIRIPIRGKP
ncbi:hypothetical protein [Citrobacter sp. RHB25-C09]|uniref:hypothetical protein n=1 Tax=Citrobacter sp. RHB25-C09 TaxID=2742624 RepID=UPI0015EF05CA|nr:hypothetical protein [Citrobacter sp. RHB25-C09]QMI05837.1 hypothetical protein HVY19_13575 [Citrobacter sp. RHB25-C09]